MSEMYNRAMDRLRDEMARHHNDAGLCAAGEMLTHELEAHPGYADRLGSEKKTLAGAFETVRSYAQKNRAKGQNCVFVPPEKAVELMLKYYGIKQAPADCAPPRPRPSTGGLDLDSLLEGL